MQYCFGGGLFDLCPLLDFCDRRIMSYLSRSHRKTNNSSFLFPFFQFSKTTLLQLVVHMCLIRYDWPWTGCKSSYLHNVRIRLAAPKIVEHVDGVVCPNKSLKIIKNMYQTRLVSKAIPSPKISRHPWHTWLFHCSLPKNPEIKLHEHVSCFVNTARPQFEIFP